MIKKKFKKKLLKKTLLYNLILFDFILLESSTNRISNFFLEKIQKKKNYLIRFSLFDTFLFFKQFIKYIYFLKKQRAYKNKKKIIYFWTPLEFILDFFKFFFKKFKPKKRKFKNDLVTFIYDTFFPAVKYGFFLKSAIFFDNILSTKKFFSFFFKKLYIVHSINSYEFVNQATYKIFSNVTDYKKLIFFAIILRSLLLTF